MLFEKQTDDQGIILGSIDCNQRIIFFYIYRYEQSIHNCMHHKKNTLLILTKDQLYCGVLEDYFATLLKYLMKLS